MDEIRILGPDGRPIQKKELTREVARASLTGVRQVWNAESMVSGLTPDRLAMLLQSAAEGDHRDYLTLAEEMEERDLHYASVLGTRKRAISGLEPTVEAAAEDAQAVKLADAVRELARRPEFGEMVDDCLDALGKSYSAVEILWDRSGRQWWPERYVWRDPRFFLFDREDGHTLRLLDEADAFNGLPLPPYKFLVHVPRLKSGLPVRGGLARLVAIAYMCKAYSITDWVAFAEVFGMPLRLGRYGPSASETDIQTLISAVANLGTDAAAVLPDSMRIDFQEAGNRSDGADLFERLATFLDKQISKAVLGQTATTEGTPGKLGNEDAQDKVRQDILKADARQLENTLNRDLVRPFIDLNFGPQAVYPRLRLPVSEPEDLAALVDALDKLVPRGLKVEQSVVRDKLGLPDPDESADLLLPAPAATDPAMNREHKPGCSCCRDTAVNRETDPVTDALDELEAEGLAEWEEQLAPIFDPVRRLAEEAESFDEFLAGLPGLREEMDSEELVKRLALATFKARGMGDATDEG
jgi:phage gp29-like protein